MTPVAQQHRAGGPDSGLIGFDVKLRDSDVRPELLRLQKRGTKKPANDNVDEFALAA